MTTPTTEELQRELLSLQLEQLRRDRDAQQVQEREAAGSAAAAAAKKEQQALADRRAQTVADVNAVTTSLGKLTGSSVTFPDKTVFREGVATKRSLAAAAHAVAAAIRAVTPGQPADAPRPCTVLVSSRSDQLAMLHAMYSFQRAIEGLRQAAAAALGMPTGPQRRAEEAEDAEDGAASPTSVAGALVGAAIAAFDLLSVETTIAGSERAATELETHVAVLDALLRPPPQDPPLAPLRVVHETIGVPASTSELRSSFEELTLQLPLLVAHAAELDAQIEQEAAKEEPDVARKSALQRAKAATAAVQAQIEDFATRATTPGTSSESPLEGAVSASRLSPGSGAVDYVAVVLPARITADQVALKRRIFAPRVVVTASATIDVLVLDVAQGTIVAAGSHTGESAFQVRFPMAWSSDDAALQPSLQALDGVFPPGVG